MYPEYQEKVVLLQECIPNPEYLNDRAYIDLNEQIGQIVGKISYL